MKRFCGFNCQQFGDLFMGTVAARCLKAIEPDSHLTYVISADYAECAPLFIDHPHIDRVHILNRSRDGFNEVDLEWIKSQRFDHVFNPMQDHDHSRPWWRERHQALEAVYMHYIPIGAQETGKIEMAKWFKVHKQYENCVAFAAFPGWVDGRGNMGSDKAFSWDRANAIVGIINDLGYRALQVGSSGEPNLNGDVVRLDTSYFESVRNILGCKLMVMGDSGLNWLLSGYDFPVLGMYSNKYYGADKIAHIQPVNPNGTYLDAPNVNDIPLEVIFAAIKEKLNAR